MSNKLTAIVFIVVLSIAFVYFLMSMTYSNEEISLRKKTEAQQEVCKANHDKMFKTISQIAQVPQKFMEDAKNAYKEIYPDLIQGRYGNENGNLMMKWVQEHNPEFDLNAMKGMYEKIQEAVEVNRSEYFVQQEKLIDLQREHSTFISKFPARLFVNGEEVEITVITSTETKNVYSSGNDDNIDLFK